MKWHYLQHVPFEGPAYLDLWVQGRGHILEGTQLWSGDSFPAMDQFDGLFILGGPMNVYDEDRYPWLVMEKDFISETITSGKPILGICLGAQLLSIVLGGEVNKSPWREIGWFPVALKPELLEATPFARFPEQFHAFHWHGDRFTVPSGAIHVASSEACTEQAFLFEDRVIGLQFHLESTEESIAALIDHCGHEISSGPHVQNRRTIEEYSRFLPEAHSLLDALLDDLVAPLS